MEPNKEKLAFWFACVITVAWASSFIVDMLIASYEPPVILTPLMLTIAGWLFGGDVMKRMTKNEREVPSGRD